MTKGRRKGSFLHLHSVPGVWGLPQSARKGRQTCGSGRMGAVQIVVFLMAFVTCNGEYLLQCVRTKVRALTGKGFEF